MKVEQEGSSMTEGRALLTEREREALADDESGSYRYKTRSYLRNRLDRLERDAELLAEREPELFERLQSAVQNASTQGESAPTAPADTSPTPEARDAGAPTQPATDSVSAVVDDVAAEWDDTDARLDARKDAAKAVLQHALDTGDAVGRSDAVEQFYDTHAVDGQNEETWWRKNIRPVLRNVGEYSNSEHGYTVDDLEG